jgi:replicative DNA helicase
VVDWAEQEIFKIAESSDQSEPEDLGTLIEATWDQIEQRREHGGTLSGLDTGFHALNDLLGGLQRGDMVVIAARPSMGKTAFAMNVAEYIGVDCRQPLAIFSLEMSKQQLAERLMCSRGGVDLQKLRRNYLSGADLGRLQEVAGELKQAPMYIDDTAGLSVVSLRAKARRLAARHGIKAIFIDYLQLASVPGAESRQQEVSEISRGVKALARELNVPVIVLSQLNRNPEGRESKRPMLSDLRESGSIEQDADVVMMLHREDYYHHGDDEEAGPPGEDRPAELIVAKQRNGPTDTVKLLFRKSVVRFENYREGIDISAVPADIGGGADLPPF